jgi:hypothetical protein
MLWEAFSSDRFPQPRKEILMNEMTANAVGGRRRLNRTLIVAVILAGVILVGLLAARDQQQPEAVVASPEMTTISQSALEEQHGLRVNLVAVTAAGGLVDVRLKILDGGKAEALLGDPSNLPVVLVPDKDVTLELPDEAKSQEIRFEDNGNYFLMFPNTANAVKPGTPVNILFGNLQLEPIAAK